MRRDARRRFQTAAAAVALATGLGLGAACERNEGAFEETGEATDPQRERAEEQAEQLQRGAEQGQTP